MSDDTVITGLARLLHLPTLDARQARRVRSEGGCVVDEDDVKAHDGVLLGGYSREADARRMAWVVCREGLTPGYAHVVAPREVAS